MVVGRGVAVVVLLLALAGCGSGRPQPPPRPAAQALAAGPLRGGFGQPITVAGPDGQVAEVTVNKPTLAGSDGTTVAPQAGRYVTFTVTIRNTGGQVFRYGPGNFTLVGLDGRAASGDGGVPGQLQPGSELAVGGVITGEVVFDGPAAGVLGFVPSGSASEVVAWRY